MNSRRTVLPLALAVSAFAPGCNPYKFTGNYNAGYLDATTWPAEYVGSGTGTSASTSHDQSMSGDYRVPLTPGTADGATVNYYFFTFLPQQEALENYLTNNVAPGVYTSAAGGEELTYPSNDLTQADIAYVFDPGTANPLAPPASGTEKCVPPKNYVFDQRTEEVRHDEQGSIFGSTTGDTSAQPNPFNGGLDSAQNLPDAAGYAPIFQEVPVTSAGEPCQNSNSEADVLTRKDVHVPVDALGNPKPDGKFLGWVMVDPSSEVAPNGDPTTQTGTLDPTLGPGRWGWWNHYLAQYLDGGYIPSTSVVIQANAADCNPATAGPSCDNSYPTPKPVTFTQYTFKSQDLWLANIYPVVNPNFDPIGSINPANASDFSPAPSPLPDYAVHAPNVNCDPTDPTGAPTNTLFTNNGDTVANGNVTCKTTDDCTAGQLPGNQLTCQAGFCVATAGGKYVVSGGVIKYKGGQPALDANMNPLPGFYDSLGVLLVPVPPCAAPAPGAVTTVTSQFTGPASKQYGYDLMEKRGDTTYSPICLTRQYAPGLDFSNVLDPNGSGKLIPVQTVSPGLVRPADYVSGAPNAATGPQTGTLTNKYGTDANIPAATIADPTNIIADANGNPYVYCLQLN